MIDLCKVFGVEEGEEFKLKGKDYGDRTKFKIYGNKLFSSCCGLSGESGLQLNDLDDVEEVIKLPKKKEFTDDELAIFRCMDKKYKWVTRDERYGLTVFENKPKKVTRNRGEYWKASGDWLYLGCFENMFQSIQGEDEEPVDIDDYVERGVE